MNDFGKERHTDFTEWISLALSTQSRKSFLLMSTTYLSARGNDLTYLLTPAVVYEAVFSIPK